MEDTTIEDVLKTVEALYSQKDYEGALRILEQNQSKVSEGVWHYNAGTIQAKLENWPMARFHLLMADSEGYSSKEVITNKNLVEEKLEIGKLENPISASDYLRKTGMAGTHGVFTSVSLILVLAALFFLWKKSSIKAMSALVFAAVVLTGLNFWIKSWDKFVVITSQEIQDGPSAIFNSKGELPAGIMLIVNRKGEWFEIIYPARFQGWIKNKGLKELK